MALSDILKEKHGVQLCFGTPQAVVIDSETALEMLDEAGYTTGVSDGTTEALAVLEEGYNAVLVSDYQRYLYVVYPDSVRATNGRVGMLFDLAAEGTTCVDSSFGWWEGADSACWCSMELCCKDGCVSGGCYGCTGTPAAPNLEFCQTRTPFEDVYLFGDLVRDDLF